MRVDISSPDLITEPIDGAVLHQAQVVLGQRGDEDDGAHVLEAVDPLPPLRPLAPDIHQAEVDLAKLKQRLLKNMMIFIIIDHEHRADSKILLSLWADLDPGGGSAHPDHVLGAGGEGGAEQPLHVGQEVDGGVRQLEQGQALQGRAESDQYTRYH